MGRLSEPTLQRAIRASARGILRLGDGPEVHSAMTAKDLLSAADETPSVVAPAGLEASRDDGRLDRCAKRPCGPLWPSQPSRRRRSSATSTCLGVNSWPRGCPVHGGEQLQAVGGLEPSISWATLSNRAAVSG